MFSIDWRPSLARPGFERIRFRFLCRSGHWWADGEAGPPYKNLFAALFGTWGAISVLHGRRRDLVCQDIVARKGPIEFAMLMRDGDEGCLLLRIDEEGQAEASVLPAADFDALDALDFDQRHEALESRFREGARFVCTRESFPVLPPRRPRQDR